MDLNYSKEELAFRDEVRGWLARQPARRSARQGRALRAPLQGRPAALAPDPRQARAGSRRPGRRNGAAPAGTWCSATSSRRSSATPARPPLIPFGLVDVRAGAAPVRHRGAEEALPAAHLQRRGFLVPGLFRARLGERPGVAEDDAPFARAITTSSTARRSGPRSAHYADWIFCLVRTDPAIESASRKASRSC